MDATTASMALTVSYSAPTLPFQVEVPVEHITEVLVEFDGRRRAFLVALLNGYSKGAAAASVGVTARAVQLWAKKDDLFAEAVRYCEDIGFTAVIETELYRRAVAGTDDRSSMRALELVLKSRRSEYRDKGHLLWIRLRKHRGQPRRFRQGGAPVPNRSQPLAPSSGQVAPRSRRVNRLG